MYLFLIGVAMAIRQVLQFKDDSSDGSTITYDTLKIMHPDFYDINNEKRQEIYSKFNITNCTEFMSTPHNVIQHTVKIPITKPTFLKLKKIKKDDIASFSMQEMIDIIQFPFIHLNNGPLIIHAIQRRFKEDIRFFINFVDKCTENNIFQQNSGIYQNYIELIRKINALDIKHNGRKIATILLNKSEKESDLFNDYKSTTVPDHKHYYIIAEMSIYLRNYDYIYNLFNDDHKLIIEIIMIDHNQTDNCIEIINSSLADEKMIKGITIRLKKMNCCFDIKIDNDCYVKMYFDSCIFSYQSKFPANLTYGIITNCTFKDKDYTAKNMNKRQKIGNQPDTPTNVSTASYTLPELLAKHLPRNINTQQSVDKNMRHIIIAHQKQGTNMVDLFIMDNKVASTHSSSITNSECVIITADMDDVYIYNFNGLIHIVNTTNEISLAITLSNGSLKFNRKFSYHGNVCMRLVLKNANIETDHMLNSINILELVNVTGLNYIFTLECFKTLFRDCTGSITLQNGQLIHFNQQNKTHQHISTYLCISSIWPHNNGSMSFYMNNQIIHDRILDGFNDAVINLTNIHILPGNCLSLCGRYKHISLNNCTGCYIIDNDILFNDFNNVLTHNPFNLQMSKSPDGTISLSISNLMELHVICINRQLITLELCNVCVYLDMNYTCLNLKLKNSQVTMPVQNMAFNELSIVKCIIALDITSKTTSADDNEIVIDVKDSIMIQQTKIADTAYHILVVPGSEHTSIDMHTSNIHIDITYIIKYIADRINSNNRVIICPDKTIIKYMNVGMTSDKALHVKNMTIYCDLSISRHIKYIWLHNIAFRRTNADTSNAVGTIFVGKHVKFLKIECLKNIAIDGVSQLDMLYLSETPLDYLIGLCKHALYLNDITIKNNTTIKAYACKLTNIATTSSACITVSNTVSTFIFDLVEANVNYSEYFEIEYDEPIDDYRIACVNINTASSNISLCCWHFYYDNIHLSFPYIQILKMFGGNSGRLVLKDPIINKIDHIYLDKTMRTFINLSVFCNLKKITMFDLSPSDFSEDEINAIKANITYLHIHSFDGIPDTSLFSSVVTLKLTSVKVPSTYTVSSNIEDLYLINVSGGFDLSKIERLKKLTLVFKRDQSDIPAKIMYRSLRNIKQLEITYTNEHQLADINVSECVCLEWFALNNEVFCSSRNTAIYSTEEITIEMNNQMDAKVDVILKSMSENNLHVNLRYLKLSMVCLTDYAIAFIRKCIHLQTLVIGCTSNIHSLFEHLPIFLEVLELFNGSTIPPKTPSNEQEIVKSLQHLKMHQFINTLTIYTFTIDGISILEYLPANLHVLRIVFSDMLKKYITDSPAANIEKKVLSKLIIHSNLKSEHKYFYDFMIIYETFDLVYVDKYIDLKRLQELLIETPSGLIQVDVNTSRMMAFVNDPRV